MRIYFEDGEMQQDIVEFEGCRVWYIHAWRGSNHSFNTMKYLQKIHTDNVMIYTNDIIALLNASELAWNGETFEIYLRNAKDEWKLLKDLTNRELRQGHNIYRLWFAGEFEDKLKGNDIQ